MRYRDMWEFLRCRVQRPTQFSILVNQAPSATFGFTTQGLGPKRLPIIENQMEKNMEHEMDTGFT